MAHKNDDLAAWIGKTEEQTDIIAIIAAWPLDQEGALAMDGAVSFD